MNKEIKPLSTKRKMPPFWTMFTDGADGESLSYTRVVGGLVILVFLFLIVYFSLTGPVAFIPPKEWIYIIISFALGKPWQRFAETKETEAQLNYDFQMAQLQQQPEPPKPAEDSSVTIP